MTHIFEGKRLQRGRGIGSLFGSVFRSLVPLGKKVLTSNVTKNIAKTAGKTLKNAAIDTAVDLLEGKNLKDSAKNSLDVTKRKLAQAIKDHAKKGVKHTNKSKNVSRKKKKRRDYFLLN